MPPLSQPETPSEHTRDAVGRVSPTAEKLKMSLVKATTPASGLLALIRQKPPGTDLAKTSKPYDRKAMAKKHSDQARTLKEKVEDLFAESKVFDVDESLRGVLLHLSADGRFETPILADEHDASEDSVLPLAYGNGANLSENKDPASRKRRKNDAIDLTEPTHAQQAEYYKIMISSLLDYSMEPGARLDDDCPINTAARNGRMIPEEYSLTLRGHRQVALCLLKDSVMHGVVVPCNIIKGIVNFIDEISDIDTIAFNKAMPAIMAIQQILRINKDFSPVKLQFHTRDEAKVNQTTTYRA